MLAVGWLRSLCVGGDGCAAQPMCRVAGPTYILQPRCGQTCNIARFPAKLKFQSWTECGNKLGLNWAKLNLELAIESTFPAVGWPIKRDIILNSA